MSLISRATWLAVVMAGTSACAVGEADPDVRESPAATTAAVQELGGIASFCGQSPTSITYWASQWQSEIMDADGVIGGCEFDASCLPSCWGGTSNWTTWAGPLIQCPCH